ncbi:MAG: hypothetical protein LBV07_00855 [Syntrophobacterales bacterium]|nr:hypothetical protein [Syntrophobacterales bacterium]
MAGHLLHFPPACQGFFPLVPLCRIIKENCLRFAANHQEMEKMALTGGQKMKKIANNEKR